MYGQPLALTMRDPPFILQVFNVLEEHGLEPVVFDSVEPNPSVGNVVEVAAAYAYSGCDSILGLGGGGPLDASKVPC